MDLLNVVEANEYLLEPSVWAFRQNFGREKIAIEGSAFSLLNTAPVQKGRSQTIAIWNYDVALKVLHYFGDSISRLAINYYKMTPDQIANINHYIAEKCVERLREIEFFSNSLDLITFKSFPNIETISFGSSNIPNSIDLNELFPKMRRLELEKNLNAHSTIFSEHFPHLEFVVVHFSPTDNLLEKQIEVLLTKNPQIKGIQVICTSTFLQTINEKLPNLLTLDLKLVHSGIFETYFEPMHFPNLKKFFVAMRMVLHSTPVNIPFVFGEQLEEMELQMYKQVINQKWLNFAKKQPNLRTLKLIWFYRNAYQLSYIADTEFKNLETFSAIGVTVSAQELTDFMQKAEKWRYLERIHLQFTEQSQADDVIKGNYINWEIEAKNSLEVTFIRIQ